MFEVTYNEFTLLMESGSLPDLHPEYRKHTALGEEFDLTSREEGQWCFVGVKKGSGWPFLTVAQRFWPAGAGFHPGALLVPETSLLFIGAGERLLAYDLREPKRLWLDSANTGFWHWHRHGDYVLMAAELEFAVWNKEGLKLWSTFVEPPWDFQCGGDSVTLDVMGQKSTFGLRHGPEKKTA
jgi:hypothetical protein